MSFVIGAFLGDGSFVEDSAWHHHVKLAVRDQELADVFNRCVATVLRRKVNVLTVTHDMGKIYYESKYSLELLESSSAPLEQLRRYADDHPSSFLRGLFSADGGCSISMSHSRLRLEISLSNSDVGLLQMVKSILLSSFGVHSTINRTKKKGSIWTGSYGKLVVLRKDAYQLRIGIRADVEKFVTQIGFVISRKQQAALTALRLIKTMGSSGGCKEWRSKHAQKKGARWSHLAPIE